VTFSLGIGFIVVALIGKLGGRGKAALPYHIFDRSMKHFTREFSASSIVTLLHVSSTAAPAAPQPPQSTVPIATIIIIVVMIAVVVATSGFLAIRKIEKP